MSKTGVNYAKYGAREIRRIRRMKKIFSMLLVICLLLSMMSTGVVAVGADEYNVSTNIGAQKFYTGAETEFTVTTHVGEGAEQKTVVGAFELYDGEGNIIENAQDIQEIVKLEYKEYPSGIWYEFYGEFGPAAGFSMMDGVTSSFKATFKKEGNYKVKVLVKDVNNEKSVLCQTEVTELNVANFKNSVIETTLPEKVYVNQDAYFTCTTTANSHAGEIVLGAFAVVEAADLSTVATLKYQDSSTGNWYEFYGDFGPAEGFKLTDATSNFCVNFKQTGTYNVKIYMKLMDNTELCAVEKTVEVVEPGVLTTTIPNSFIAEESTEFTVTTVANGDADRTVKGAFELYDSEGNKIEDVQAIQNIVKLEYQEYPSGIWYEFYGDFGPATGFKLTDGATSNFRVTFKKIGTYSVKIYMKLMDDTELCAVKKTVEVTENDPPVVESCTVDNESWATSKTVTVNASDKGGSTVVKVMYSSNSEYVASEVRLAELDEESSNYKFQVNANGKYYVWAEDGFGNRSEAMEVQVWNIDITAAEITDLKADPESWTNGKVVVKVSATDNESGVEKVVFNTENQYSDTLTAAEWDEEKGCYTFEISADEYFEGNYYVWALDKVGKLSEVKAVVIKIEKISPTLEVLMVSPEGWTNGNVTISGRVLDDGAAESGVAAVYFNSEKVLVENDAHKATFNADAKTFAYEVEAKDFNGNYYFWAKDTAGNVSECKSVKIQIDVTKPVVESVEANPDVWTNGAVTVTGSVSDIASAVANSEVVAVYFNSKDVFVEDNQANFDAATNTFTYTVSAKDFEGYYYFWAKDTAGNVSASKKVKIQIDVTKPVVESVNATVQAFNDTNWTNQPVKINGEVSDIASANANSEVVTVYFNKEDVLVEDEEHMAIFDAEENTFTYTVDNKDNFEGYYYFWAKDAAGNISASKKVEVKIDVTDPSGRVAAEFYFEEDADKADHCTAIPWTDLEEDNEALNYTLWANKSINIIVVGTADNLSQVAKVEYFVDYFAKGNDLKFKTSTELDGVEWELAIDNVIPEINTDSRFIAYVKVTDNAGNYTYISTNGLIVDTHKPTGDYWDEKIEIKVDHKKEDATNEALDPKNQDDLEKLSAALYTPKDDVTVAIEVYEPKYFGVDRATKQNPEGAFSGLSKITYEIFVDEVRISLDENGTETGVLFDYEGKINADGTTEGELELISKWTGSIKIDKALCNSNNVELVVTAIDNAGNIAKGSTKLMIDITVPVINVVYSEDTAYSNKTRTATVYVQERNFVPFELTLGQMLEEDAVNMIAATFGSTVEVTEWELVNVHEAEQMPNGDHITYKKTVTFSKDDHYQISGLNTVDAAGNTGSCEAGSVFTIDKNKPKVSVSYNNNSAENGKYFDASRTATVTIVEHNFDQNRVNFTQTAGRGGVIPNAYWRHDGDTHIATFSYTADGDYTFDVSVTDLAGNVNEPVNYGSSVAAKDFVVDQTIAKPVIEGVANGCAYKEDVIPVISFSDINFDTYELKLLRTRMGEKNVDVTEQFLKGLKETSQGGSGTFDTFEKIVENDGIYTLTVKMTDKAGNEASEEYTFTVNRFGSVYEYSDELVNLIKDGGQYVKSVDGDLLITEYNAERLLAGSLQILITRDGETVDVDYTCNPEVNDKVAIGESGWYQYVYTIKASNFEEDGVYKISLASEYATVDSEKNESSSVPENSIDKQGGAILDTMNFTVDSVAPEIRNIVNLDKKIADKDKIIDGKLNVKYTIVDVGGLKTIEIIVNGVTIQTFNQEDIAENAYNFTGSFDLSEQDGTNAHKVQIRVTDLAGNVTDTNSEEFRNAHSEDNEESTYVFYNEVTVSRNFFVRWYANKGLFWGSIGGAVVLITAVCCIIAAKKKKNEEV